MIYATSAEGYLSEKGDLGDERMVGDHRARFQTTNEMRAGLQKH